MLSMLKNSWKIIKKIYLEYQFMQQIQWGLIYFLILRKMLWN